MRCMVGNSANAGKSAAGAAEAAAGNRRGASGGQRSSAADARAQENRRVDAGVMGAAADASHRLAVGVLLRIVFGPKEGAGGQYAGAEQDQGKFATHTGHGTSSPHWALGFMICHAAW